MSSSKPTGPRQVPPPPNSRAGNSYTRFIPREELQGFASWTPTTFGEGVDASAMPPGVSRPQPDAPGEPVGRDAAIGLARNLHGELRDEVALGIDQPQRAEDVEVDAVVDLDVRPHRVEDRRLLRDPHDDLALAPGRRA